MIRYDSVCCIAAALLLLMLPADWLLSAVAAALVHETAHIVTVLLLGGRIHRIRMSLFGCVIECGQLTDLERIISSLAGPAGSLFLVCFRRIVPQIAICGLFQGFYNLLPVLPLDGGRILQIILYRLCPEQEKAVMGAVKYVFWFAAAGVLLGIISLT